MSTKQHSQGPVIACHNPFAGIQKPFDDSPVQTEMTEDLDMGHVLKTRKLNAFIVKAHKMVSDSCRTRKNHSMDATSLNNHSKSKYYLNSVRSSRSHSRQ